MVDIWQIRSTSRSSKLDIKQNLRKSKQDFLDEIESCKGVTYNSGKRVAPLLDLKINKSFKVKADGQLIEFLLQYIGL